MKLEETLEINKNLGWVNFQSFFVIKNKKILMLYYNFSVLLDVNDKFNHNIQKII